MSCPYPRLPPWQPSCHQRNASSSPSPSFKSWPRHHARRGGLPGATFAECLIMPVRLGLLQPQQDFADVLVQGANMTFVPLDAAIARNTAELRVKYNLGLADAFQLAAALASGCGALLTNDQGLKRVQELPIL